MLTADTALRAVAAGLAAVLTVAALEYALLLRAGALGPGGLFDWDILRLRRTVIRYPAARPLDRMFASPNATGTWLATAPLGGIGAAVFWNTPAGAAAALLSALFLLLAAARFPFGRDGADQVALFWSLAVLGYQLHPTPAAATVFGYLICAQLTGGYAVAGWSKLSARDWTRGSAMAMVLHSSCYGNPPLAQHVPLRAAYLAGLAVAIWEATFPAVWLLPEPAALTFLAVGVAFHLGCWLVMGLNTFLLTFAAGYPALVWLVSGRA
ncbi:MAG: hypothetical protein HOQ24_06310 [Mycobacteriaceae bacterium]|nr:hypothetical protein [Mycobacteriaceae bacterium]